jgi:hypothetical protein
MRVKLPSFPSPGQPGCQPSLNIAMSTSPLTLDLLEVKGMQANTLLQELENIFPPTNPNPEETMEKIMYKSGQRSVVEWINNYMEAN